MLYTIARDCQSELAVEKSRFICRLAKVADEDDVAVLLKSIKKEHFNATHHCLAYVIGAVQRASDDGEPTGTAGMPMLEVLRRNSLDGVAAIVTRYFGGVKLGTGGLARAYSDSVVIALKLSGLAQKILLGTFTLPIALSESGKTLNLLYTQTDFSVISVDYTQETAVISLSFPQEEKEKIEANLTRLLNKVVTLALVAGNYIDAAPE